MTTLRSLPALLAVACAIAACADPAAPVPGAVLEITIDSAAGPLTRSVELRMDQPAPAEVVWGAPGTPVLRLVADSASLRHRFTLPRLRAERVYALQGAVPGGTSAPVRASFGTGSLPPELSGIAFQATGVPSVPVSLVEVVGGTSFGGLLIVEDGEIVGYRKITGSLFGMTRRKNGDLVLLEDTRGLVVYRLDGTEAHRLPQAGGVPGTAYGRIHHDVTATPRNTLLFIANEQRLVGATLVTGEALWEWSPEAGTVVKRWSAFDHLDYPTLTGSRSSAGNWLHGNGISFGPRGNVLMSLRNVDQVISIAPDFSRVEWSLGGTNGTLAVSAGDRFLGQHYVSEPEPNRVLVYDNGYERPGGPYTRAIEYYVDAAARTATRVWQYRHSPDIYAALVGSAVRLPNGNTTVLFGMSAGHNESSGPITAVEVAPVGTVQWRLSPVGTALSRLYRVTPVASLVGETPGAFRSR